MAYELGDASALTPACWENVLRRSAKSPHRSANKPACRRDHLSANDISGPAKAAALQSPYKDFFRYPDHADRFHPARPTFGIAWTCRDIELDDKQSYPQIAGFELRFAQLIDNGFHVVTQAVRSAAGKAAAGDLRRVAVGMVGIEKVGGIVVRIANATLPFSVLGLEIYARLEVGISARRCVPPQKLGGFGSPLRRN